MNTSYRMHAERRANLVRAPAPAARPMVWRPLALPPWGYGAGRPTTPAVNDARRTTRSARQTNSGAVGLPHWSNSPMRRYEFGDVVETKNEAPVEEVAGPSAAAAASGPPSLHAYRLDALMTGGGRAVTSSSMETWTTNDDGASTSPRCVLVSPHGDVVAPAALPTGTPPSLSPAPVSPPAPQSPTTATDAALRAPSPLATLITPASPSSDLAGSPKSPTPATPPTTSELLSTTAQEVATTPRSAEQRTVPPPAESGDGTADKPVDGGNVSDRRAARPAASQTDSAATSSVTSTKLESNDDGGDQSTSLMVGLVKVRSRHTGLMIDCPILETTQPNDGAESPASAVRPSGSHKVVLIKAVVPRRAWNGRAKFAPPASPASSARSSDRSSVLGGGRTRKRRSVVTVDTQTSDTLLFSRRADQPPSPASCVPALEDHAPLVPSPKLSASSARAQPTATTPTDPRPDLQQTFLLECRVPSSPEIRSGQSSARAQMNDLIEAETSSLPPSPVCYGNVSAMPERHRELDSMDRRSTSMDDDSLMEETNAESLKLDLPLSSDSGEYLMHERAAAEQRFNRPSSLSSSCDEAGSRDQVGSRDRQALLQATINWSCAAAENFQAAGYRTDQTGAPVESPTSSHRQKPRRSPPSHRHSPATNQQYSPKPPRYDEVARRRGSCQSSAVSSPKALPPRSPPYLWRDSVDDELGGWCDFNCGQDPSRYDHRQHVSSATAYALGPNSSLYDEDSKSAALRDRYKMTTSPTMSSRFPHGQAPSSTPAPGHWVDVADQEVTVSGASDTDALDDSAHLPPHQPARHPANNHHRSDTADDVDATTRRSRHKHRRSTPANEHHATQQKPPRRSRLAKRCDQRQRRGGTEVTRRGELAQSSQSAGSMTAPPRDAGPSKRQQSLPASRHEPPRDARRADRFAEDRRAPSSRGQYRSTTEERQRRRQSQQDATSTAPSAAHQRRAARTSTCKTAVQHANNSTSKHATDHQPRGRDQRHEIYYECPQPVRYCSPRSRKQFPPPISDRRPPSFDDPAAAAAAVVDAESGQYEFVDDSDDHAGARRDRPPRRQERLDDHQRRRSTAAVVDSVGQRRGKKPPVADAAQWRAVLDLSAGAAVPSVVERPAWKRY